MAAGLRFKDWPLRAKMALLLVAASLVPLGIATWTSINNARADRYDSARQSLSANAELLAREIDAVNASYLRFARILALSAEAALEQLQGEHPDFEGIRQIITGQAQYWMGSDPAITGIALLDGNGHIALGTTQLGTSQGTAGLDLSYRKWVRTALEGKDVVSDVFMPRGGLDEPVPTVAYVVPVMDSSGKVSGAVVVWVDAKVLSTLLRELNDKIGPGSFASLFDGLGIRIANGANPDAVFHPVEPLSPEVIEELVAEQRFGSKTRELVTAVQGAAWDPQLGRDALLDFGMFRTQLPGGKWARVFGWRCSSTSWVVYYALPESVLLADVARIVREKLVFAAIIMMLALLVGALVAAMILRPLRRLADGAVALGAGDFSARVQLDRRDELGALGATFNQMAARIQEQAEALRRESEAQYRQLFQTMTEAFCTIEVIFDEQNQPIDFKYLETNREFDAQTGFGNVVGRTQREVVPTLEDRWMRVYGRVALTGEAEWLEDEADGRFYDVRAYKVGGPESRKVAVLFNDVTERRLTEQRRKTELESLNLLQQITRAIGERQDLPSIFQEVLRALEGQLPVDFGCVLLYRPDDAALTVVAVGEGSRELADAMQLREAVRVPIDKNGLSRCVRGQLVHESDISQVQFAFPQRLACAGLASLVAAPLLVESRVFGVLVVARRAGDFASAECEFLRQLSEHVALAAHQAQLYENLQAAYDELRQTQQAVMQQDRLRALGQMASGIAHDINNAVSPIALYADSMMEREAGLSDAGRAQLQTIQRAIHDVAATVSRMREFYRANEPQLMQGPVQLNELVPQVLELTKARWSDLPQQRGITIDVQTRLQAGLPEILGAANEIREALTNLVFNAVDAMPAGGVLTVATCTVDQDRVLVSVTDTGIGMDEESRRRCLEPFFTTKGERGTGLGLAMVYGMVQRHQAQIEMDSTPGHGTSVSLVFPVAGAVPGTAGVAQVVVPRGLRILVVDDDPVLLRSLSEVLQQEGHQVTAASGGHEGIEAVRSALAQGKQFSVVITDLGMPRVDGRQVAQAVKQIDPAVPVVLLTGWGERLASEGDVPSGVDLLLSKPPKLRDLRGALARVAVDSRRGQ